MSVLRSTNVVAAFIVLLLSVSSAENEKKSVCDTCECSEYEVKCNSMVDPELMLAYNGYDVGRLSIVRSELGYLRKEYFAKFQNVSSVFLNSDKLAIDSSSLSLLTEVTVLNLDNNSIEVFATGIFDNNVKLLNLSLNGNKIRYIANNTFVNLHKLTNLLLANNSIEDMDIGAFGGLSSLEELDLGGNRLLRAPAHAFSPLARLRVLSLRDNLLEEVEEGAWSGLEAALEELDLSGNRLLRADAAAFAPLRALLVLRLERNRIASFGPALVEALAQRPGLSAQLQPNPLRCACGNGELRDAWEAASARGLRWSLVCADGRPWDAAMRDPSCSDVSDNAAGVSSEAKEKTGIETQSTSQENYSNIADSSSDKSTIEVKTILNPPTNFSIIVEENETSLEGTPILNKTTSNTKVDISAEMEANLKSQDETFQDAEQSISEPIIPTPASEVSHEIDMHDSDVESEIPKSPSLVETVEENDDINDTNIQDPSIDNSQSLNDDATTSLNPAQLVALVDGIEMADAIWQVGNGEQQQQSSEMEVSDGNLSPAQLVALAEGIEMAEAVAQAAKEVEPSMNAIWKATLEAESSFRQNNAPEFEEGLDTALITLLVCVLIVFSVTGSAVALVLYHKLKNSPEEEGCPPNMYVLVADSESQKTSVDGLSNFSDIRGVSYSFPDLDEVTLS